MEANSEFFGLKNLRGYTYYYHLPRLSFQLKKTLSDKIVEFEGKITFTLKHSSIIIIQRIKDLDSDDFEETIKAFGDIDFFHKNEVFHIQHNRSLRGNSLKCILLSDFNIAISQYESQKKTLEILTINGLPKYISKEASIGVLLNNEIDKKTHYHEFQLIHNSNKDKDKEYDIPQYTPSIHNEFSLFCTENEKKVLNDYLISKDNLDIDKEKDEGDSTWNNNDIKILPKKRKKIIPIQPYKEHTYCHLCKKRYDDYFIHLKSKLHCDKIKQHKSSFDKIENTFDRIRSYWKEQNDLMELQKNNFSVKIKQQSLKEQKKVDQIHKDETLTMAIIPSPLLITSPPQQATPQTQYATNISGNDVAIIDKPTEKKYGKRKYAQLKSSSIFDHEENSINNLSSLKGTPTYIKNQLNKFHNKSWKTIE